MKNVSSILNSAPLSRQPPSFISASFKSIIYMHIYVCMYVCACVGRRTTLGIALQVLFTFLFLRQSLSLAWSLMIRLGWPVSKYKGSSCLHLPSTGITRASYYAQYFCMDSVDQTQVLILVWQYFPI